MKFHLLAIVTAPLIFGGATKVNAESITIDADVGEFFITLDQTSFEEGDVVINVDNQGSIGHVIAIDGTGLSTSYLTSGSTGSISGALAPGSYDVICTISGHAAAGMRSVLVVNASTTTSTTVNNSSTTTAPTSDSTAGEPNTTLGEEPDVLAASGTSTTRQLFGGLLMALAGFCVIFLQRLRAQS